MAWFQPCWAFLGSCATAPQWGWGMRWILVVLQVSPTSFSLLFALSFLHLGRHCIFCYTPLLLALQPCSLVRPKERDFRNVKKAQLEFHWVLTQMFLLYQWMGIWELLEKQWHWNGLKFTLDPVIMLSKIPSHYLKLNCVISYISFL